MCSYKKYLLNLAKYLCVEICAVGVRYPFINEE